MPDEPPVTSADPAIAPTVNGMESGAGGLAGLSVGGGCAAKYAAARLEELVRGLAPARTDDLLVGLDPSDDAAVYRLDDERALVFTVDFFPPLVDDPALFGRIAATNALNDVFAMGGRPLVALSVAAFPEELGTEVVSAVFAGAAELVRVAGAVLAGGHTIRDREPKYGLAVVGTVHPDGVWVKSGARPGDAVFLTKPLGTGLVLAAKANLEQAARWMTTLNDRAADLLRPFSPNAVTDVTGFGLLGHARETAERSGVRIRLRAGDLPAHAPAAIPATGSSRPDTSRATVSPRSCWPSPTTRRPRAGCWSRCRPRRLPRSQRSSPGRDCSSPVSAPSRRARASCSSRRRAALRPVYTPLVHVESAAPAALPRRLAPTVSPAAFRRFA